jgi:hypothetical protein
MMKGAAAAGVGVVIALTIACDRSATAPSPAPPGSTGIVGLVIRGPERLTPGETARFTAMATASDGSTQDYTQKVTWNATPQDVLTIARTTGEATARKSGDAIVWAGGAGSCCAGTRMAILVVPPDTYRLTGRVAESSLPVQGATVAVVSGAGAGLSAVTNFNGEYRLYGVAGATQIKVSKAGYVDLVKNVAVSANEILDFPEARQQQSVPSISGMYVLTVAADSSCPTTSTDRRTPHLPAEMQQARNYVVRLTQDGPVLHVAGSAPSFLPPQDRFDGRITPDGVEFQIGDDYFGYDDTLTAWISPTQAIAYEGHVFATRVGSAIVGRLDGEIRVFERTGSYQLLGQCRGGHHRFSLSAGTSASSQ